MIKKFLLAFWVFLFLLVLSGVLTPKSQAKSEKSTAIPDKYIVVFKDSVENPEAVTNEHASSLGFLIEHSYDHVIKGYSANISKDKVEKIKTDERVQFISEDREVSAIKRPRPSQPPEILPKGISRIGVNSNNKGSGVGVAILDTGIDLTHPDLAANIIANKTCISGTVNGMDDNGHGTHVAGTVAGVDNTIGVVGVAPEAKLVAVKVLNSSGSGTWSSIICGIDWVTANAANYNIKVANMSLGGSGVSDNNCGNTNFDALHKAICNSTASGVTYVVAAGNNGSNANGFVPASYDDTVITVSALADSDGGPGGFGPATSYGSDDTFASFSNYGSVVDLAGPGASIFSTWKGSTYNTISGTSMAAPHVAGSAALYVKTNPGSTWLQVKAGLISAGEALNAGHTDPSGLHFEPVVRAGSL